MCQYAVGHWDSPPETASRHILFTVSGRFVLLIVGQCDSMWMVNWQAEVPGAPKSDQRQWITLEDAGVAQNVTASVRA